jgi:hypothetical protein
MVALHQLWLPIVLSSVFVFVVSSIIHMMSPWHKGDYKKVPDEDKAMDALRTFALPPGEYLLPCPNSAKDMKSPEFIEKKKKGPTMIMTVWSGSDEGMGKFLVSWFLYLLVVGFFCAYIAGRALPVGANYLQVFRFAGATAFIAHTVALWPFSIWYHRPWSTTIKSTFDGLIYALLTAGTFGWLWVR